MTIFDASDVHNADDGIVVITHSNDNESLDGEQSFIGLDPSPPAASAAAAAGAAVASSVEHGNEGTVAAFQARGDNGGNVVVGDEEDEDEDEEDGPCSNDNPNFDKETQPCPGAVDGIFDGIESGTTTTTTDAPPSNDDTNEIIVSNEFATTQPTVTTTGTTASTITTVSTIASNTNDEIFTTNNVVDNNNPESYPSFYSCTGTSEDDLVQNPDTNSNANGQNDETKVPITFNYEIYTATSVEDVTAVLRRFERQLANGVASSLGLVDCLVDTTTTTTTTTTQEESGLAVEFSRSGGGRQRRTLHKGKDRLLSNGDSNSLVVGVSMNPVDDVDTSLEACTSSATVDIPSNYCSPIVGAMTAWVSTSQQRSRLLRHLVDSSDPKEEQEAMLLQTVQSYIEENQSSYLTDDLLHVSYVGHRDLTGDNIGEQGTNVEQIGRSSTQIPIGGDGSPGMNLALVGLAAAAVLLTLIATVAAVTYRNRRGRREPVVSATDLESGACPGLSPESQGENARILSPGALSEASVVEEEERSPSSLAVLGAASSIVRQLSYSPPIDAYTTSAAPQGQGSVADESAMTEDSERLNLQPASNDVGTVHDVQADSFDSEPFLSPMNVENANGFANDSDVQSAFEDAQEQEEDGKIEDFGGNDENDQQEPVSAQVTSATTAEPAETGQVFDDASSISSSSSEADDEGPQDDPEDSGIMV